MSRIVNVGFFESGSVNRNTVLRAEFKDTSSNRGILSGLASFTDTSFNASSAFGLTIFTEGSYNSLSGISYGTCVFLDNAVNYGVVENAIFLNGSRNLGTVTLSATFAHNSLNQGIVQGDAIFIDKTKNYGTINGTAFVSPLLNFEELESIPQQTKTYIQQDGAYSHGYYINKQRKSPVTIQSTPNFVYQTQDAQNLWMTYTLASATPNLAQGVLRTESNALKYFSSGIKENALLFPIQDKILYYEQTLTGEGTPVYANYLLNEPASNDSGIFTKFDSINDFNWKIENGSLFWQMITAHPFKLSDYYFDTNKIIVGTTKLYNGPGTGATISANVTGINDVNFDGAVDEWRTNDSGIIFVVNRNGYYSTGYYVNNTLTPVTDIFARQAIDDNKYYTYNLQGRPNIITGLFQQVVNGPYYYINNSVLSGLATGAFFFNQQFSYFVEGQFITSELNGSFALSGNTENYRTFSSGNETGVAEGIFPLNGNTTQYFYFSAGKISFPINRINLNNKTYYYKGTFEYKNTVIYLDPQLEVKGVNLRGTQELNNDGIIDQWGTDEQGVIYASVNTKTLLLDNKEYYYTGNLTSGVTVLYNESILLTTPSNKSGLAYINSDLSLDSWNIDSSGIITWSVLFNKIYINNREYYYGGQLVSGQTTIYEDPTLSTVAADINVVTQGGKDYEIRNGIILVSAHDYQQIILDAKTYYYDNNLIKNQTVLYDANYQIATNITGTTILSGEPVYYSTDRLGRFFWGSVSSINLNGNVYYYKGELSNQRTVLYTNINLTIPALSTSGSGYDFNDDGYVDSYEISNQGTLSWIRGQPPEKVITLALTFKDYLGETFERFFYYRGTLTQGTSLYEDVLTQNKTEVAFATGMDYLDEDSRLDVWLISGGEITWEPLSSYTPRVQAINRIYLDGNTYYYIGKLAQNIQLYNDSNAASVFTPTITAAGINDVTGSGILYNWTITLSGTLSWGTQVFGRIANTDGSPKDLPGAVELDNTTFFYRGELLSSGTVLFTDENTQEPVFDIISGKDNIVSDEITSKYRINKSKLSWLDLTQRSKIGTWYDSFSFVSIEFDTDVLRSTASGTTNVYVQGGYVGQDSSWPPQSYMDSSSYYYNDYYNNYISYNTDQNENYGNNYYDNNQGVAFVEHATYKTKKASTSTGAWPPIPANKIGSSFRAGPGLVPLPKGRYDMVRVEDIDNDGIREYTVTTPTTWPPTIDQAGKWQATVKYTKVYFAIFEGRMDPETKEIIFWDYNNTLSRMSKQTSVEFDKGIPVRCTSYYTDDGIYLNYSTGEITLQTYANLSPTGTVEPFTFARCVEFQQTYTPTLTSVIRGRFDGMINQGIAAQFRTEAATTFKNGWFFKIDSNGKITLTGGSGTSRIFTYSWNPFANSGSFIYNVYFRHPTASLPALINNVQTFQNYRLDVPHTYTVEDKYRWWKTCEKFKVSDSSYRGLEHFPIKQNADGTQIYYDRSPREWTMTDAGRLSWSRPVSFIIDRELYYVTGDVRGQVYKETSINNLSSTSVTLPVTSSNYSITINSDLQHILKCPKSVEVTTTTNSINVEDSTGFFFTVFYVTMYVYGGTPTRMGDYTTTIDNKTLHVYENLRLCLTLPFTSGETIAKVYYNGELINFWNYIGLTDANRVAYCDHQFNNSYISKLVVASDGSTIIDATADRFVNLTLNGVNKINITKNLKAQIVSGKLVCLDMSKLNTIDLIFQNKLTTFYFEGNHVDNGVTTLYTIRNGNFVEAVDNYPGIPIENLTHYMDLNADGIIDDYYLDKQSKLHVVYNISAENQMLKGIDGKPITKEQVLSSASKKIKLGDGPTYVYITPALKPRSTILFRIDDEQNIYVPVEKTGYYDLDGDGIQDVYAVNAGVLDWRPVVKIDTGDQGDPRNPYNPNGPTVSGNSGEPDNSGDGPPLDCPSFTYVSPNDIPNYNIDLNKPVASAVGDLARRLYDSMDGIQGEDELYNINRNNILPI